MLALITEHWVISCIVFVLCTCGAGLLFVWIAERSALAPFFRNCAGVVAPYCGVLALLFGLFVIFLTGDIWNHRDRADAAVAREADAIRVVRNIAGTLGDQGKTLEGLLASYGKAATAGDWRSAARQREGETLSRQMIEECLFGEASKAGQQTQKTAIDAITELRNSRRERMSVALSPTSRQKWVAALVLGMLAQMALVMVHLGHIRPSALAVTHFTLAMTFILWVTLVRIDPFLGVNLVSLQPINAASQGPR